MTFSSGAIPVALIAAARGTVVGSRAGGRSTPRHRDRVLLPFQRVENSPSRTSAVSSRA